MHEHLRRWDKCAFGIRPAAEFVSITEAYLSAFYFIELESRTVDWPLSGDCAAFEWDRKQRKGGEKREELSICSFFPPFFSGIRGAHITLMEAR